jgi:hypothetical protein
MRFFALLSILILSSCHSGRKLANSTENADRALIAQTLRPFVMQEAEWAMQQEPVTVTASHSERSAGGLHDFFSEGDYWWPDPAHPDGPYIQRDGMTNPDNFVAHRHAMIRLSKIVGALASAYLLTGNQQYVMQAMKHCRAWFADTATLMNPNLLYAQAIKGRYTGRGIGIIDTIHLIEVVQGLLRMEDAPAMDKPTLQIIKKWFDDYIHWLNTHPYGIAEMNARNNHGTCWTMQVAAFARFTRNEQMLAFCRKRFKEVLLPGQMAADGSFPLELARTKPYGYSIFNLDAMAGICQIASTAGDDLWQYRTADGRSLKKGIEFLFPYIEDKSAWRRTKDVMFWDQWPVAQPFLVFGALAYHQPAWLQSWQKLDHDPQEEEIIRNVPLRHPLIWIQN